jgi:hypothetical protein
MDDRQRDRRVEEKFGLARQGERSSPRNTVGPSRSSIPSWPVGGNVISATDLVKTGDGDGGGKGGGGGGTGPTYAANFAILICEGSGDKQLGRIWAGPEKRLVFDPSTQKLESARSSSTTAPKTSYPTR